MGIPSYRRIHSCAASRLDSKDSMGTPGLQHKFETYPGICTVVFFQASIGHTDLIFDIERVTINPSCSSVEPMPGMGLRMRYSVIQRIIHSTLYPNPWDFALGSWLVVVRGSVTSTFSAIFVAQKDRRKASGCSNASMREAILNQASTQQDSWCTEPPP